MSRALFAVAIACAVAVAVAQPAFPDNWTSDQTNQIAINQGGVKNPDGSICCPPDAPECKVQTGFSAAIQYQWYSGNMSATKGPDNSGIVVDFNAQKEYAVLANGTCTAYCPLGGQTMSPGIGIGPNATNLGKVNYNGRMLNLYQVLTQIPILNITMEATNFYVDESGASPVPVAIIQLIEPLGHQIGQQNNTFVDLRARSARQVPLHRPQRRVLPHEQALQRQQRRRRRWRTGLQHVHDRAPPGV